MTEPRFVASSQKVKSVATHEEFSNTEQKEVRLEHELEHELFEDDTTDIFNRGNDLRTGLLDEDKISRLIGKPNLPAESRNKSWEETL
jgi:hypothetical protein